MLRSFPLFMPLAGMPVVIGLSGCTSDIRVAEQQPYHHATVGCAWPTVQGYTASNGNATFVIMGGASSRTDHPAGCARVHVDSHSFGTLRVDAYDQNGNGVDALSDLACWARIYFAGRSDASGSSLCP